jgi:hypothetical protein
MLRVAEEISAVRACGRDFSMTIRNTAFYALSVGMLVLLGALLWATGPDLMLVLVADLF